jgi:hypothetical protein
MMLTFGLKPISGIDSLIFTSMNTRYECCTYRDSRITAALPAHEGCDDKRHRNPFRARKPRRLFAETIFHKARLHAGDFDLVLLCHSIPMKDRDHLTCLMRATGSLTPVVSIARNLGACDAFVNATLEDGPNKFLAGIGEELGKAARRSANGMAH